jgi:hypothetical protein
LRKQWTRSFFQAFRDDAMIQAFAYVDQRAQDDGVVGAERNAVDEAAINFRQSSGNWRS